MTGGDDLRRALLSNPPPLQGTFNSYGFSNSTFPEATLAQQSNLWSSYNIIRVSNKLEYTTSHPRVGEPGSRYDKAPEPPSCQSV